KEVGSEPAVFGWIYVEVQCLGDVKGCLLDFGERYSHPGNPLSWFPFDSLPVGLFLTEKSHLLDVSEPLSCRHSFRVLPALTWLHFTCYNTFGHQTFLSGLGGVVLRPTTPPISVHVSRSFLFADLV